MAEAIEEIIIIEDSEAAQVEYDSTQDALDLDDENSNKKKNIIFGAIATLLILIIFTTLIAVLNSSDEEEVASMDLIEEKLEETPKEQIETSKLESMIAKANYL
ncbi:MAG: hypothetical protein ABFQ64_09600, partial [Campylobacterota bacterium]